MNCSIVRGFSVKKMRLLVVFALLSFFGLAATANAQYASYSADSAYLSWTGAQSIFTSVNSTETTQTTPHGGYTQSTVKCAVCHSTHRAYSAARVDTGKTDTGGNVIYAGGAESTAIGLGYANNLLPGSNACIACHASSGSNATSRLIEFGTISSGPHMTADGADCNSAGCHGPVHGGSYTSKYAIVRKFNLANQGSVPALDAAIDAAIASGNIPKDTSGNPLMTLQSVDGSSVAAVSLDSLDQGMKAYATGYVCYPCHGASSRSVANSDFVSPSPYKGHLSVGTSVSTYIPTCEGCHDVVGVSTNSTIWPHANRGIDVYVGRFNHFTQQPDVSTTTRVTSNNDQTRYGLWMTSANYADNHTAEPIVKAIANSEADWLVSGEATVSAAQTNINDMLVDGTCIKCHKNITLRKV